MRVLVCGSRTWTDYESIANRLKQLAEECEARDRIVVAADELISFVVIVGGAKGVDTLAEEWAERNFVYFDGHPLLDCVRFPADWAKYGKAAGPIRNRQMLTEGRPDLVLAFWDGKSRGTANMIELARTAGVPVEIITLCCT